MPSKVDLKLGDALEIFAKLAD